MRKLLVVVLLLAGAAGAGSLWIPRAPAERPAISRQARKGSFRILLIVEGEFKASENREIRVNLEAYQEDLIVRKVVPEGSLVKPDDLLIEFDSSKLRLEIDQRENQNEIRRKDLATADEDLKIAQLERTFLLDDANTLIALAKEDLEKYRGIEGPRLLKEAEVKVSRAEYAASDKDRIAGEYEKMAQGGTISAFELRKAQQEARDAHTDLEIARLALRQLAEYDHPNRDRRCQSAVGEKQLLLETRRQSSDSKVAQKESAVVGIRLDLQRKEAELTTLKRDLERFQLRAPLAGFVLYGSPSDNPWQPRNEDLVLKEGSKVYPRRTLMTIPDLSVIKVMMHINERDISKVKAGQTTAIDAAALPGIAFTGAVDRIAQIASAQKNWMPQDNSFEVESTVSPYEARIKPGMKCKVSLLIEEVHDVLCIPLVAVREREGESFCVLDTLPPVERKVKVGRCNDEFAEILEGITDGERLMLGEAVSGAAEKR